MDKKDFVKTAKQIKSLIRKYDGEIPLSEKSLDELFRNIDAADLYIAKREYLKSIGTPEDVLDDDTITGLILSINIDEWAPTLFKLLGKKKALKRFERKRIVCLDNLGDFHVDVKTASRIERGAWNGRKITRLYFNPINNHTVNILTILFEDPDITEEKIAKTLGLSRGYVCKLLQGIRKHLSD